MRWWRLHRPTNFEFELVESLTELQAAENVNDPARAMREMIRFGEQIAAADRRLLRWWGVQWIIGVGALYGWLCFIQRWWPIALALGILHAFIMSSGGRNHERTKARMTNNTVELEEMRHMLAHLEGRDDEC